MDYPKAWDLTKTDEGRMRWTLDGFVIGGRYGTEPAEGHPCVLSHGANGHENAVEFPSPEAARKAVSETVVEMEHEGEEPVRCPLAEWMAHNTEDAGCGDAAMELLREPSSVIPFGGGAATLSMVKVAKK